MPQFIDKLHYCDPSLSRAVLEDTRGCARMYKLVLLLGYLVALEAQETETKPSLPQNNAFDIGPYIQNFKTNMLQRVQQEQNLTKENLEKVENVLEDFLRNFAKDLGEVISKQQNNTDAQTTTEVNKNARTIDEKEITQADIFTAPSTEGAVKSDSSAAGNPETQSNHYDEIKKKIRLEFPEVNEDSAAEIVVRLRHNLLMTREKLDQVLGSSAKKSLA